MASFFGALLAQKHADKIREEGYKFQAAHAVMTDPNQPSEYRQRALEEIYKLGGSGAKEHEGIFTHLKNLITGQPATPQLRVPQLPAAPTQDQLNSPEGGVQPSAPAPAAGVPPPPPVAGAVPQLFGSPEEMGQEQLRRSLPALQFQMQMDPVLAARARQRAIETGINWDALTPTQKAQYMKEQTIPEVPFHTLSEGQVGVQGGKTFSGLPKPVVLPEGSRLAVPNQAQIPPPPGMEMALSGVPPTTGGASGYSVVASSPPRLNDKESLAKKAVTDTLTAHGLPIPADLNPRDPWSALPANLLQEAQFRSDPMLSIRANNLKELQSYRRIRAQEVAIRVKDFQLTHSPEYIQSFVDMMKQDPDLYFDQSLNSVRPLVAQAWRQDTGLPIPRKLDAGMKSAESLSQIALAHLNSVRELLQDPVIQKRIGPLMGRFGKGEENIGADFHLTDEESQKIQAFRTNLAYFFFREGKSLLSGRPAERLMEQFASTSARPEMKLSMLKGALDGAERAANSTIKSAERYRFGGKSLSEAKGRLTPPPGGPTVGTVEDGYRFKGGDPANPGNWEEAR